MQRNPHSYQIATGYRTFYSLSLIYQPITKKRLFFNENCKNANRCLRHQIVRFIPDTLWAVSIVNPARTSPTGKCAAFMADTPVQYAVGMDHLLDQIPYLEAKRIKQRLLMTYGKNKFYQFKRKERTFSPEDQQYIRQVFRAYGVEDEPVFDAWQSGYRWTKG